MMPLKAELFSAWKCVYLIIPLKLNYSITNRLKYKDRHFDRSEEIFVHGSGLPRLATEGVLLFP